MSSKRRLRRKECEGKRRFATQGEAHTAVQAAQKSATGGRYIDAYQCEHCAGWHIGHKPGSTREHTELFGEVYRRERYK